MGRQTKSDKKASKGRAAAKAAGVAVPKAKAGKKGVGRKAVVPAGFDPTVGNEVQW